MTKSEMYYQVMSDVRQEQEQCNRDFDLKAIGCLGIATTLLGMGAILLNSVGGTLGLWIFTLLGPYLVTLLFGLKTLWLRDWRLDPDPKALAKYLEDYDEEELMQWVGNQFLNAVDCNGQKLREKSYSLRLSICSTILLPIFLLILVVVAQV